MIGKEIADLLVPFIIAGAVLGVLYFLYRRFRSGIRSELQKDQAADAEEDRKDALTSIRRTRRRMRDALRRGWLRQRKDNDVAPPD